jgi:glucosamine--fructose-6-phosphate aminotransferase (isomerizing)
VILSSKRVVVTGAGGASFAAKQIAFLLRQKAKVDAWDVPAYDLETLAPCVSPGDILLTISQSGETADTIEAVRLAEQWGMRIATIVNMPMSSMTRMAEHVFYNRSGPEICVLSTKSASAQVTFGLLLAASVSRELENAHAEVDRLSRRLSHYLDASNLKAFAGAARGLARSEHVYLLGRSAFRAVAEMGALNIKEASYIHAEAFSAGELKHGVIALIEEGTPVILFAEPGDTYMINVAAEVKSRGARLIAVSVENNELFDDWLPMPGDTPDARAIAGIIPCQLLAYFLAIERGLNPDKPRNLAKSVTVR